MNSDLDGTITRAMIEKMNRMKHVCKNICFSKGHNQWFSQKTDGKDPKKRKNYWMKTLKTYAPFGLNIKDSI